MSPIHVAPRFAKTMMALHVLQVLALLGWVAGLINLSSKEPLEQLGSAITCGTATIAIILLGITKLQIHQLNESARQSALLERQAGLLERMAGPAPAKPAVNDSAGPTRIGPR